MIAWRKSSRSGSSSGNCVEVGAWRKSSRSGNTGGNCVEVGTWRKSSRSSNTGGNCVEAGALINLSGVAVRDTKDRQGPMFVLTPTEWSGLLADIKRGDLDPS